MVTKHHIFCARVTKPTLLTVFISVVLFSQGSKSGKVRNGVSNVT